MYIENTEIFNYCLFGAVTSRLCHRSLSAAKLYKCCWSQANIAVSNQDTVHSLYNAGFSNMESMHGKYVASKTSKQTNKLYNQTNGPQKKVTLLNQSNEIQSAQPSHLRKMNIPANTSINWSWRDTLSTEI